MDQWASFFASSTCVIPTTRSTVQCVACKMVEADVVYLCTQPYSVPVADGVLRLQDGPSLNEGRLEIRYKNLFGGVCDDNFGASEAATACHQLGFAGAEQVVPCCHGPRRHGEIWLDDVDCNSGEVWLYNCTHGGWGVEDCHLLEEVGVKCNGTPHI